MKIKILLTSLTIFGITINIHLPSKSCGKISGTEPQYNYLQYNDIPGLTMEISLTECKIFLVITIKSIPQTTEMLIHYNKTNFYYINNNYKLFLTCFKAIEEYSGCYIGNSFDDQFTNLLDNIQ